MMGPHRQHLPEVALTERKARRRLVRDITWSVSDYERRQAVDRWTAAHDEDPEALLGTMLVLLERLLAGERLL
jgi:hypothetical protein